MAVHTLDHGSGHADVRFLLLHDARFDGVCWLPFPGGLTDRLPAQQPLHGLYLTKQTEHLDQHPVAWNYELHSDDRDLARHSQLTAHRMHAPENPTHQYPGWG
jgi:hypothetical protein